MLLRTETFSAIAILTLGVASIKSVGGISIDGQLTVIKNDCYERMAIGEKLSPRQTYKTFDHNTVSKCETECTQEKETCRAYSFGIGTKGNATCLLSRNPVKETADLKPIGTISDTDYDLYIKKLDCQVILNPPQHQGPQTSDSKPVPNDDHHQQIGYEVQDHHNVHDEQSGHYGNSPDQSSYHSSISDPNQDSGSGYHYDKPQGYYPNHLAPASPPNGPSKGDGLHHVQTVVSIASGPQSVLHPVHDILISEDSYGQGNPPGLPPHGNVYGEQNGNMPPFRPTALNHPYDEHRPVPPPQGPQDYGSSHRPNPDYEGVRPLVPPSTDVSYGYGDGGQTSGYFNDNKPIGPHSNDFNTPYGQNPSRPHAVDDRPDPDYGPRPVKLPDYGYGNGGTQLTVDRRKYESFNAFNSFESEVHGYRPEQPKRYDPNYNFYDHYEKPSANYPVRYGSVIPHPNDYDRPDAHNDYLFVRPNPESSRPSNRPSFDSDRPSSTDGNSAYDRPDRPSRPRPEYADHRPSSVSGNSGYDRPDGFSRPRPEYGGPRPADSEHDRPARPLRPGLDYDGQKPLDFNYIRPDRPSRPGGSSYDNPSRPNQNSNKKPTNSYNQPTSSYPGTSSSRPPSTELTNHYGGVDYTNKHLGKPGEYYDVKGEGGDRRIVTESIGYNGEKITSIITELRNGE